MSRDTLFPMPSGSSGSDAMDLLRHTQQIDSAPTVTTTVITKGCFDMR